METDWYRKTSERGGKGADAVALPPLHRTRQQPRLHASSTGRDEGDQPRPLPRLVPAGLPRRAPDRGRAARGCSSAYAEPLDPASTRSLIREENLIGSLMWMRFEQEGKSGDDLGLGPRRLLAGRLEEHGVVEERDGNPDRGRVGPRGDAGRSSGHGAAGRGEGPRQLRDAGELPEPLARRGVAPARHHGLRTHRLRRDPRVLRDAPPRRPLEHARAGTRLDRRGGPGRGLPDPDGPARPRHGSRSRRAPRGARRRGEGGCRGRRVGPARAAVRSLRAGDAGAAALSRGEARPGQGHRRPVRRHRLEPAALHGSFGGEGDSPGGPPPLGDWLARSPHPPTAPPHSPSVP